MDRRVKERLVGATILAVLIVLIVPELLSGPKSHGAPPPSSVAGPAEPLRNVTVDLATSKATPAEETPASAAAVAAQSAPGTAGTDPTGGADATAGGDRSTGSDPTTGSLTTPVPGAAAGPEPAAPDAGRRNAPGADAPTIVTLKAQQPAHADGAKPAAPREPAAVPPSPGRRWEVQLGSFASRSNADKLVRQLKAEDPSLHVSASGKGAALRYRVRVGPLADRESAERVLARMRKEGRSASLVAP
jgi:DedD protein